MQQTARISRGRQPAIPHPHRERRFARAAVLQAARNLFRDEYYDQISVEQIAACANITRYTLCNHFTSKAEIFRISRETLLNELADKIVDDIPVLLTLTEGLVAFASNCYLVFADERNLELSISLERDRHNHSWLAEAYRRQITARLVKVAETFLLYKANRTEILAGTPRLIAEQMVILAQAIASEYAMKSKHDDSFLNMPDVHFRIAANSYGAFLAASDPITNIVTTLDIPAADDVI
jgi:AcrR family transcriptional regulator